jgi:hypothetical protein
MQSKRPVFSAQLANRYCGERERLQQGIVVSVYDGVACYNVQPSVSKRGRLRSRIPTARNQT